MADGCGRISTLVGHGRLAEDMFLAMLNVREKLRLRAVCKDLRASVATWRGDTAVIDLSKPNAIEYYRSCFPRTVEVAMDGRRVVRWNGMSDRHLQLLAGAAALRFQSIHFRAALLPGGFSVLSPSLKSLTFSSCSLDLPADCLACCTRLETLRLSNTKPAAPLNVSALRSCLKHLCVTQGEHSVDRASMCVLDRLCTLQVAAHMDMLQPEGNAMLAGITKLSLGSSNPIPPGFSCSMCRRLEALEITGNVNVLPQHLAGLGTRCRRVKLNLADVAPDMILPQLRHVTTLEIMGRFDFRVDMRGLERLTKLVIAPHLYFYPWPPGALDQLPPNVEELEFGCEWRLDGSGLDRYQRLVRLKLFVHDPRMISHGEPVYLMALPKLPTLRSFSVTSHLRLSAHVLSKLPQLRHLTMLTMPVNSVPLVPAPNLKAGPVPSFNVCPELRQVTEPSQLYSYLTEATALLSVLDLTAVPSRLAVVRFMRPGGTSSQAHVEGIAITARTAAATANTRLGLPLDSHARWEVGVMRGSSADGVQDVHGVILYHHGALHGVSEDFEPPVLT